MRITSVKALQLGVLRNVTLGPLNPALNIIFGPNEAGKTTLKQSLRIGLYPITSGTAANTYGEGSAQREVELTLADDQREYSVVRRSKSVKTSEPLEGSDDSLKALDRLIDGTTFEDYQRLFHVGCSDIAGLQAKNISPLLAAQWPDMGNPASLAAEYITKEGSYAGTITAARPLGMKGLLTEIKKQEDKISRLENDMKALHGLESEAESKTTQCETLKNLAAEYSKQANQIEDAASDIAALDEQIEELREQQNSAQIRSEQAEARYRDVHAQLCPEVLAIAPVIADLEKEQVGYETREKEIDSRRGEISEREIDETHVDDDAGAKKQHAQSLLPIGIGCGVGTIAGILASVVADVLVGVIIAFAIVAGTLLYGVLSQRPTDSPEATAEAKREKKESVALEKARARLDQLLEQQAKHRTSIDSIAARVGQAYPDEMSCRGMLEDLAKLIKQHHTLDESSKRAQGEMSAATDDATAYQSEAESRQQKRCDALQLIPEWCQDNVAAIPDHMAGLRRSAMKNNDEVDEFNRKIGELTSQIDQLKATSSMEEEQVRLVILRQKLARSLHQRMLYATAKNLLTEAQIALAGNDKTLVDCASEIFAKMTGERYSGIDCNESEITAINARGDRVSVSKLSAGTFEQLFLALRLGVVLAMPDFGGSLPLVLDDVFCHTDQQRLETVLATLARLSLKKQILYFTCHASVADLFVEVAGKVLPADNVKRFDLEPLPI